MKIQFISTLFENLLHFWFQTFIIKDLDLKVVLKALLKIRIWIRIGEAQFQKTIG